MKYVIPSFEIMDLYTKDAPEIMVLITSDCLTHRDISNFITTTPVPDIIKADEISIITPETMIENSLQELIYHEACVEAEIRYNSLIKAGVSPQIAHKILPLGMKVQYFVLADKFMWKTIFRRINAIGTYPETRVLMNELNKALNQKYGDQIPLI